MRSTMTKAAAFAAAGALSLTLAACGGSDGDAQAFCEDFSTLEEQAEGMFSADIEDEESTQAAVNAVRDNIASIDAPDEISEAWGTLSASFETLADAMEVMVEDPENIDAIMEAMGAMAEDDFLEAGNQVDAYVAENCTA